MVKLLETTLRDGSYSIDFQFTAKDTGDIAKVLEGFGFEFIEIGHGLGLNASNCGKGGAAATDEEYMRAASSALKRARWGMFFIPGIGRSEDIDMAADHGMGFMRVGTNITEIEQGERYIDLAKKKGLFVSANLMKSYAVSPQEFAAAARLAQSFGADIVCLVDSAGGMLPSDVEKYYQETRLVTDVRLGFHGHNNLQLATANTLMAVDCGAYLADCSLQGLGRSAGNAATEVMVMILKRRGLFQDLDINALMDFSARFIKPLIQDKGIDSLSLTSGYAQFHSSYFSTIFKYAEQYRIDPRELIVEVCKRDVVNAPDHLVQELAAEISYDKARRPPRRFLSKKLLELDRHQGAVELEEGIGLILKDLTNLSRKLGKSSVFNIFNPLLPKRTTTLSRFIQESFSFVVGSVEVATPEDLGVILDKLDGEVEAILYDAEQKHDASAQMLAAVMKKVTRSSLLLYRDTEVWAKAIENLILEICRGVGRKVLLTGRSRLASALAMALHELGYQVYLAGQAGGPGPRVTDVNGVPAAPLVVDVVVGLSPGSCEVDLSFAGFLSEDTIIIDGGIGAVASDMAEYALARNLKVIRVDMRATLDGEIREKLNTRELANSISGRRLIGGVECVAGGVYGREDAVVLDSIIDPKYVVGLADGMGHVKRTFTEREREIIRRVEEELFLTSEA